MSDTEPQMQPDDAEGAGSGPEVEAETPAGTTKTKKVKTRRGHLPRRISAWVLVVLAAILIPVSVISVWAIRTVTNTDKYVETMAPLARNQVIVDGLATRATDALFSTHIVQNKITNALPKAAKPLVAPITQEVHSYVYGLALKVFESPKFGKLWDTLNRHSHDAVINILTGKQTPLQKKFAKGGAIALNLSPALNNLISNLDAHGVTLFNPIKAVSNQGVSFTVVSKAQVSKFSGLFNLIIKLKWLIPVIAIVLAILAVALALERRKTLLRLAIGVALMSMLVLAALSAGRGIFIGQAASGGFKSAGAASVWDTVLRFLKSDLRWTLLISVLVAFGAWVAGPARYAVWIRRTCVTGARWVAAQSRALSSGAGRVAGESSRVRRSGAWIVEHLNGLRIVGVVVAGLILIFGGNLTGWTLLVIALVLAAYLGLLQLVAAWARRVTTSDGASVTSGTH
jgi:heme/copper-type cytochrome/quinol oxidase subunit 2